MKLLYSILLFFVTNFTIFSQTAWTPYQRQLWVRPMFNYSQYNSAFLGENRATYDDKIIIRSGFLSLEYGITDRITVDVTGGIGKLSSHRLLNRVGQVSPQTPAKYGSLDTRYGIRFKITDEFLSKYSWMPTLTLRIGGIARGDYDKNPQALGDGASGGEINLYFAKDFNFYGLGVFGDVGYRRRQSPVPDDVLTHGAVYYRFLESWLFTIGYRGQRGQSGYAFADPRTQPPYNLFEIPVADWYTPIYVNTLRPAWGRKENFSNGEISLGYTDSYGNFWNVFASHTFTGFNTAQLTTVGFLVNFPFYL